MAKIQSSLEFKYFRDIKVHFGVVVAESLPKQILSLLIIQLDVRRGHAVNGLKTAAVAPVVPKFW